MTGSLESEQDQQAEEQDLHGGYPFQVRGVTITPFDAFDSGIQL